MLSEAGDQLLHLGVTERRPCFRAPLIQFLRCSSCWLEGARATRSVLSAGSSPSRKSSRHEDAGVPGPATARSRHRPARRAVCACGRGCHRRRTSLEAPRELTVLLRAGRHGLRRQWPREAREADLGRVGQRQGPDFHPRQGRHATVLEIQIVPHPPCERVAEEMGLEPGSGTVEVNPISAPVPRKLPQWMLREPAFVLACPSLVGGACTLAATGFPRRIGLTASGRRLPSGDLLLPGANRYRGW